jgi:hypothetical protein
MGFRMTTSQRIDRRHPCLISAHGSEAAEVKAASPADVSSKPTSEQSGLGTFPITIPQGFRWSIVRVETCIRLLRVFRYGLCRPTYVKEKGISYGKCEELKKEKKRDRKG